jgi:glycosyltransferase involved in cell wall biosynthesis
MELPLVSIVTPSYNMGSYIAQTIESVLSQDYPRIEYVVVDGGSTDGTLDILRRYQGRLRFTSGRDCGPADAINRGFRQTNGSIFAWLNADDYYLPGAIRGAVEHLHSLPEVTAVYGNAYWTDAGAHVIGSYPTRNFDRQLLPQECFICQPACFMRSGAFASLMLNTRLQYAFDYDLWIRASDGWNFQRIAQPLACSRMHLENRTLGQRFGMLAECLRVLRCHYGYVPFRWVHTYCSYVLDRKDQFYDPLRPTIPKYLLSLPAGCWYNRKALRRYWTEWRSVMSRDAFLRRLRERPRTVIPPTGGSHPGAE